MPWFLSIDALDDIRSGHSSIAIVIDSIRFDSIRFNVSSLEENETGGQFEVTSAF